MINGLLRCGAMALSLALPILLGANGAQAQQKLRVGNPSPEAFSFIPIPIGIAKGLWKKHGLDIESFGFAGSARLQQALAADSIDIGVGSGPELAFIAKGAPVLGVAAIAGPPRLLEIIVRNDLGINSIADLKGHTIAVSTSGSLTEWVVRELSRRQGWGPDGIKPVPLGAVASEVAALRTNQVDGMVAGQNTTWDLSRVGFAHKVVNFGDVIKDFHIHVVYASNKLMAQNPDAVRRFLAGWFDTIQWMRDNKAEAVQLSMPLLGKVPQEVAEAMYDDLMPMFSADGRFQPKALAVLAKSFVDMNLLPQEPDMSKLYTEKFLPGAAPAK